MLGQPLEQVSRIKIMWWWFWLSISDEVLNDMLTFKNKWTNLFWNIVCLMFVLIAYKIPFIGLITIVICLVWFFSFGALDNFFIGFKHIHGKTFMNKIEDHVLENAMKILPFAALASIIGLAIKGLKNVF